MCTAIEAIATEVIKCPSGKISNRPQRPPYGSALRVQRKGSRERMKIIGDRGQPWRVPFVIVKKSDLVSLTLIAAKGQE